MPPPSSRRQFPDEAHEALATWVEETLTALTTTRADVSDSFLLVDTLFGLTDEVRGDVGRGKADNDDTLLLVDTLFVLLDSLAADLDAHRIRIDALHIRAGTAIDGMDALQARVAALEQAHAVLPGPDAAG